MRMGDGAGHTGHGGLATLAASAALALAASAPVRADDCRRLAAEEVRWEKARLEKEAVADVVQERIRQGRIWFLRSAKVDAYRYKIEIEDVERILKEGRRDPLQEKYDETRSQWRFFFVGTGRFEGVHVLVSPEVGGERAVVFAVIRKKGRVFVPGRRGDRTPKRGVKDAKEKWTIKGGEIDEDDMEALDGVRVRGRDPLHRRRDFR